MTYPMKILHSADWHLDAPLVGWNPEQTAFLRQNLLAVPEKLADLCRRENCDMVLLAGDLFDGAYSKESFRVVYNALAEMNVPVFISPGNHDFCQPGSPYLTEVWPENVHIFTQNTVESVTVPGMDCRIYGAGYRSMDCPGLLEGFQAQGDEQHHIAVLHGDPTQKNSDYCPITESQAKRSGLDYLALGHIHKAGQFRTGGTVCGWPGCPMGKGYDELEEKGAYIVTVDGGVRIQFVPLDTPRFHDWAVAAGHDALASLNAVLPAVESQDFYRITLTGESAGVDMDTLYAGLSRFPNLELRDRTVPETDIWGNAGEDTLEGLYFGILKQQLDGADEETAEALTLAARISRQILDGQEVVL